MFENMTKAQAIIAEKPLPEDAREKIDKLYEASDDEEKQFFGKIYEGLFLQENK